MGGVPIGNIPTDHPYRRLFARLEKQAASDITAALDQLRRDVFRGIGRENVTELYARLRDPQINERLRQAIYSALLPTVDAASEQAKATIESEVLGVKALTDFGFNWEMVNTAARDWLRRHTFLLTYANEWSITQATEKRLRGAIDDFIVNGDMTINQLSRQVEGLFDIARGEMIAVTEVTRAFAQGNLEAWRATGVIEKKRWNTAADEMVCPICAPLNGVVVAMGEAFGGFYDSPPAHPRCRCWVTPVVEVQNVSED